MGERGSVSEVVLARDVDVSGERAIATRLEDGLVQR